MNETLQIQNRCAQVNLSESIDDYKATFALPGLSKKELDVSIAKDLLCVWGRGLCRSIPFPKNVDPKRAVAKLEAGVLTVRVPKILLHSV